MNKLFTKHILLPLLSVLFLLSSSVTNAQSTCLMGANDGGLTFSCNSAATVSTNQGNWRSFSVVTGIVYNFYTESAFDTRISGNSASGGGGTVYFDQDIDNKATPVTNNETVSWTSTVTGTIYVSQHYFSCTTWNATSSVLGYNQTSTVTNTTSTADLCMSSTRTASATVSSGTATPTYSVIAGTGNGTMAGAVFTPTVAGTVTIRATLGVCTSDISFTIKGNPTTANAGPDQTGSSTCGLTTVTLAGNPPSIGTGAWSIVSGAGGSVTTPSSATSTFSGTAGTTYTLRWTISNSPCTASTDDVVITFNRNPTTANAGPDQTSSATCGLTSVTLAGNPPSIGTGAWSIVSGAGGSVTTPSSATSTFSGTAGTTYTLRWTISNSPCTASTDDVVITFNQNPTTANAGPDQTSSATCGLTSVTLAGNPPSIGTGAWSIVSGAGGAVTTPSSATSTFSGTAGTTYTLRWTISNSPCTASTDDVVITFNQNPTTANAGPDQTSSATCGLTSVTLAGNPPSIGTGAWSIVSGAGGSVTTPSSATSTFSGTAGTTYTLRWTISNSPCTASTDDVVITFNRNPTTANAGPDQTSSATCGLTSVTLAGNPPSIGTGAWSIVSGAGGSVTTPSSATSTFSGTAGTTYTLRWTISNSPCTASTDDVVITFNQNPTTANAGPDQTSSATCGLTSVTLAGNPPSIGTGAWSIVSGAGGAVTTPSSATSTFSGTAGTTYTLRWTISNSPCTASTDDVVITFNQNPTTANAGPDQTSSATCGLTSVTLAGNPPSIGTGAWSIVSGAGGSVTTPSSATSTFSGTAGTTYTLRWTISNSPCTASTDDVVITFNQNPTTSNAGSPQTICATGSATLAANAPSVGTGAWTVVSGPNTSTSQFSSTTSNAATFTPAGGAGSYVLRWTITNAPCTASTSDVTISVDAAPTTAAAGNDQSNCNSSSFTLAGNNPSIGTGAWTVVSGSASITTPAANNSGVTGVTIGTSATLRWTISNGVCTASSDDVVLTNTNAAGVPTSGGDQEACYRATVPDLAVTVGAGETADWYTAASGGTLKKAGSLTFNEVTDGSGSNPTPNTYTYYVEGRNTTTGCISTSRTAVTLTIRAVPVISPTATPNTACSGDNVLLDANATAGSGTITAYAWSSGLGAVASGTVTPTSTTTYTVTVTNSYTCTNSASATVTIKTGASYVVLPSSTVTTLVEQCTDGGWTYYANSSTPDDWTFAIRKNGNTFTAQVDITVAGSTINHLNTSRAGYEHGSYLMKRYWDVSVTSGSISTSVDVKFFYDPAEKTAAESARDAAWASYSATASKTAFRWFKTVGSSFGSVISTIDGNSFNNFSNVTLTESASGTENGVTYAQFNGITSFSGGTGGYGFSSPGTGLPVKLIDFTATAIENSYIHLDWSTAIEVNNAGFEIERSIDGAKFTKIGWLDGHDNSTTVQYYTYNDKTAQPNVHYYYRLKQIDNGNVAFEYSNIVTAIIISEGRTTVGDFVPNPARDKATIDLFVAKDQTVFIDVYEVTGKFIKSEKIEMKKGFNSYFMLTDDLSAATYVVSFKVDDQRISKRLNVLK